MPPATHSHTPTWLWLWLPLVLYFGHYVVHALLSPQQWDRWVLHELGFTEQATVALAAVALLFGIAALMRSRKLGVRGLPALLLLFCLGCLYFGGEEASWGQHWFGWGTPEALSEINLQQETNVHNLEGTRGWLLNKLPRNLLTLAIIVGGIVIPLVQHRRRRSWRAGSLLAWIMPRLDCLPAALVVAFATMPQKIGRSITGDTPWLLDITEGEVKELMIAAFLMIYIISLWLRMRASQTT